MLFWFLRIWIIIQIVTKTTIVKAFGISNCEDYYDWHDRDNWNDDWECDSDNECHRYNRYRNSYMATADQKYQDALDLYNAKQTTEQSYDIIIIQDDNNNDAQDDAQETKQKSFGSSANWTIVAVTAISAFILLVIILIILVAMRR